DLRVVSRVQSRSRPEIYQVVLERETFRRKKRSGNGQLQTVAVDVHLASRQERRLHGEQIQNEIRVRGRLRNDDCIEQHTGPKGSERRDVRSAIDSPHIENAWRGSDVSAERRIEFERTLPKEHFGRRDIEIAVLRPGIGGKKSARRAKRAGTERRRPEQR